MSATHPGNRVMSLDALRYAAEIRQKRMAAALKVLMRSDPEMASIELVDLCNEAINELTGQA